MWPDPPDVPPEFHRCVKEFFLRGVSSKYYDIRSLDPDLYDRLPYCIRHMLESAVRNCDHRRIRVNDVASILNWSEAQKQDIEIPFVPARVLLQDFTAVPALVDLAAMRDVVLHFGGDPLKVDPVLPVDIVVDHSVSVDYNGEVISVDKNQAMESLRNKERFQFLRWSERAFSKVSVIPPGSGILHQINLEYLLKGLLEDPKGFVYPDSVVGQGSHVTMSGGAGVLSWSVAGIIAEAAMLGQPIMMPIPQVIGVNLVGQLVTTATCTDLAFTLTKLLRDFGVDGKFIEFFGPGVASLSIPDRASVANLCPAYGAKSCFFPCDENTLRYLAVTGRDEMTIELSARYMRLAGLFVDTNNCQEPKYSEIIALDLSTVVPCVSGPKLPHDCVGLKNLKREFRKKLVEEDVSKGYNLERSLMNASAKDCSGKRWYKVTHGTIVLSAITSSISTSNPSVMIGAGLLAKNAVEVGLFGSPIIKRSFSPGSSVVRLYLQKSGLLHYLEQLGYYIVGFGCMTAIGNSGSLSERMNDNLREGKIIAASITSGGRNFEGNIHPFIRANYLASPLLVIAFGLAGKIDFDFEKDPLGLGRVAGSPKKIYLRDIWPSREEIAEIEKKYNLPENYEEVYNNIKSNGGPAWHLLEYPQQMLFPWNSNSSYIKQVPYFDNMTTDVSELQSIQDARLLLWLGNNVSTEDISPSGDILKTSPASLMLLAKGVPPAEYVSYRARRGNHEVVARGTYCNPKLVNKLLPKQALKESHCTLLFPSGMEKPVFEVAQRYKMEKKSSIVFAGKNYGCGSIRDSAVKGPYLLGVKAIIAESFDRLHRTNLIAMGILPLEFLDENPRDQLDVKGNEIFTIDLPYNLTPKSHVTVRTDTGVSFNVRCRLDTDTELMYYKHGGILHYVLRTIVMG